MKADVDGREAPSLTRSTEADGIPATNKKAKPKPVTTHRTVRVEYPIPFRTRVVRTDDLRKGVVRMGQAGRTGTKVRVVRETMRNGKVVSRSFVREIVVKRPASRVRLVGTYVAPAPVVQQPSNCDPNYSGACVPIASDVDCGGGSGNGPEYVYGTVRVTGSDIYGLDSDGDGYGCE